MIKDPVQRALDSLSDASQMDWDELEAQGADDDVRATLHALKDIAAIARAHEVDAPAARALPFTWGPLEARAYLARGAHGDLYRAWDPRLEREVALKLLRPEGHRDLKTAFAINEGRLLARVRHPNVVAVFGADRIDGQAGLWMELVDGATLRDLVAKQGPIGIEDAAGVGIQVCDGLTAIHAAGLVHRDVKAQNVVRTPEGRAILMDLGAGQDDSDPQVRLEGTPLYLAPEVLEGGPATVASDIYALGVLLFFLITGRYPVTGESLEDLRRTHGLGRGERLTADTRVPPRLAEVVDRAMSADPARRYSSAAAFRAALEAALASLAPLSQRHLAAIIGLAAFALTGMTLAGLVSSRSNAPEPDSFVLGRHTRLTSDAGLEIDPAISPDGRFVAYSTGQPGYMRALVRNRETGRAVNLTEQPLGDERRPRWSPGGERVLFTAGGLICVVSPNRPTRGPTVIPAGAVRSAAWDSDGRKILFLIGDRLLSVDAHGGTPQVVRSIEPDAVELSVSPDGSRIAYVTGNPDFAIGTTQFGNLGPRAIRVSMVQGPRASVVLTDPQRTSSSPVWSFDGRSLFFVYDADGRRDVHVVDFDTQGQPGPPRRITSGLDPMSVSLSGDGQLFTYATFTRRSSVWSVETPSFGVVDFSTAIPLTSASETVEEAVVSPDGRWLYFHSDRYGSSDVFRQGIGQQDAVRLTSHASDEFPNDVSADGQEVAIHAFRNGRREVFVMPAAGGPETFVAPGLAARWSPDGSQLLIADVVIAERIGTTHRVLRREAGGRWGAARSLGSQKCTHLVWTPQGDGFIGLCEGALVRRGLDGAMVRRLYGPPAERDSTPLALAVSDSLIYFKTSDARGRAFFWSMAMEGGTPRLVLRLDDPSRQANRASFWVHDGTLYLTLEDRQGDVWVADLHASKSLK